MIALDRVRACSNPECREVLPADPYDPEGAGFYVNRRLKSGRVVFSTLCKPCLMEQRRRRRREDPVFAERERAARARWAAKNQERLRDLRVAWHRRWRAAHREEYRELQRIYYRLRAQRDGRREYAGRRRVIDGTRPERPAGPFAEWLAVYRRVRGLSVPEVARELGLVERRVLSLLSGDQAEVSVDVVSRALTEARVVVSVGGRAIVTFDDLYGDEPIRTWRGRLV